MLEKASMSEQHTATHSQATSNKATFELITCCKLLKVAGMSCVGGASDHPLLLVWMRDISNTLAFRRRTLHALTIPGGPGSTG